MRHHQGANNPPDLPPTGAPGERTEDADPPRLLFWRRALSRRPAEPPPPIWELPEIPTLWTRLKHQARQQADRWLGDRARDDWRTDQSGAMADATGQGAQQPAAQRTRRREDTASLRPPAATSAGTSAGASVSASAGEDGDDLAISSAVLESAYEAVRQGRISDPATIRQVAARFAQLTADDESGSGFPFDPQEAVRRLRQRATEIAQQRGLREDLDKEVDPAPTKSGAGSSSRGPRRPTSPRMERDENITRGG